MRFAWTLAWRYFFSKKNPTAVNWISGIALVGYGIGAAALLILLSALNGFESLIFDGYQHSDADYRIVPAKGKTFALSQDDSLGLAQWPGVQAAGPVVHEKAILQHDKGETVVEVMGLSDGALACLDLDTLVVAGDNRLNGNSMAASLAAALSYRINLGAGSGNLTLMAPDPESVSVSQTELLMEPIVASALLSLEQEGQSQRVYVSLALARRLFRLEASSNEWFLSGTISRQALETWLSQRGLVLENRQEQHRSLYKMFNTEKWVAFGLFIFVLLLISFNLLGSLSMLVLAKRPDMRYLQSAGLKSSGRAAWVFYESLFIGGVGTLGGLLVGFALVWAQHHFGFVQTQGSFSIPYPVQFRPLDLGLIMGICLVLSLLSAVVPALLSARNQWGKA